MPFASGECLNGICSVLAVTVSVICNVLQNLVLRRWDSHSLPPSPNTAQWFCSCFSSAPESPGPDQSCFGGSLLPAHGDAGEGTEKVTGSMTHQLCGCSAPQLSLASPHLLLGSSVNLSGVSHHTGLPRSLLASGVKLLPLLLDTWPRARNDPAFVPSPPPCLFQVQSFIFYLNVDK